MLRRHREYECGRLAYFLNFARDEYENEDFPDGVSDESALKAWLLGWDEASAMDDKKESAHDRRNDHARRTIHMATADTAKGTGSGKLKARPALR